MLGGFSLPVLGAMFAAAAVVVWVASVHLSKSSDLLADRWNLGQALAGLVLLAVVEDLPEVVIAVVGTLAGHLELVTGNLLGGIATQTVLLVAIDALGVRERPLSYRAASPQMVLVGLQGLVIFGLMVMATQAPASLYALRLDPGSVAIAFAWLLTTWLIGKARAGLPWREEPRDDVPPEVEQAEQEKAERDRSASTGRALLVFVVSAAAILVGGTVLEEAGSGLADGLGIGGIVFGATILALATGLPEFVTGYTVTKQGDFVLAVSEVFGSNSFLPVLLIVATVIAGRSVLPRAGAAEVYLTGLGIVLTTIYLFGLLFRPSKQYLRLGPDSIAVLLIYLVGIVGLLAIAGG